jgi:hypothetical protein
MGGFLLFALYLKWQPWHSRLHLPWFVLWSPVIGLLWGRYRRVAGVLAAVLLCLSVPWVASNDARPLLGPDAITRRSRVDQYFSNRPELRDGYVTAMHRIQQVGCREIGFWLAPDSGEYPLWVLAGHEGGDASVRIEHIYVPNASARAPLRTRGGFNPCAILLVTQQSSVPDQLPFNGLGYHLRLRTPPLNLYLRE